MLIARRIPGLIYTYRTLIVFTLSITFLSIYSIFKWNVWCANFQAWQHINQMCKLYEEGRAVGSLCAPLCTNKAIHLLNCHSYNSQSKEVVFSAEFHQTRLIFKAATTHHLQNNIHWFNNGIVQYPTDAQFLKTINTIIIANKLNTTIENELLQRLSKLKPGSGPQYDEKQRRKEMDNLWILLQDKDYLFSVIFQEKSIIPQLLGTCGSYFAMEWVDPIQVGSVLLGLSDNKAEWSERLRLALQIIDLMDELDFGYKPGTFHFCNLHLRDFGIVQPGYKLKLIDLESVYTKGMILRLLGGEECRSDDDCRVFDCKLRCRLGKCAELLSSNLQIICEKIFLGWRWSGSVIVPGLLMSQHTPAELASVLRQCAEIEPKDEEEIKKRLVDLLGEIEQSVNNDEWL